MQELLYSLMHTMFTLKVHRTPGHKPVIHLHASTAHKMPPSCTLAASSSSTPEAAQVRVNDTAGPSKLWQNRGHFARKFSKHTSCTGVELGALTRTQRVLPLLLLSAASLSQLRPTKRRLVLLRGPWTKGCHSCFGCLEHANCK